MMIGCRLEGKGLTSLYYVYSRGGRTSLVYTLQGGQITLVYILEGGRTSFAYTLEGDGQP